MELAARFKALSDETRLRMMGLLLEKELCVCEVMDILEMNQSRVSRHMGILKRAGLVVERRDRRWVFYRHAGGNDPLLACLRGALAAEPQARFDRERMALVRARCAAPTGGREGRA